jgi:hypothetical protein
MESEPTRTTGRKRLWGYLSEVSSCVDIVELLDTPHCGHDKLMSTSFVILACEYTPKLSGLIPLN